MIRKLDCVVIAIRSLSQIPRKASVLVFSYRGYGPSEGTPTEAGLKLDAESVMGLCRQFEDINRSRVFLFGRSLGGAVAIDLASKHQDKVHRSVSVRLDC